MASVGEFLQREKFDRNRIETEMEVCSRSLQQESRLTFN